MVITRTEAIDEMEPLVQLLRSKLLLEDGV